MSPAPMERAQSNRHHRASANFAMRHQKKTIKLGRTAEHRKALLANQVCSLIEHQRIRTTLAKAKAVRPLAEKMVTLGKKGSIHARRTAFAVLRQKDAVKKLFDEIAPRTADRNGGFTPIVKIRQRKKDYSPGDYLQRVYCATHLPPEFLESAWEKRRQIKKDDGQAAGAEKSKK